MFRKNQVFFFFFLENTFKFRIVKMHYMIFLVTAIGIPTHPTRVFSKVHGKKPK